MVVALNIAAVITRRWRREGDGGSVIQAIRGGLAGGTVLDAKARDRYGPGRTRIVLRCGALDTSPLRRWRAADRTVK
ncbi:hypothetical protein KCP69_06395 [Salmonella enterica subsp. enterica]|nr:hypothetical protein KCP69_06395 [Salmonella enterica subsp. enterica]